MKTNLLLLSFLLFAKFLSAQNDVVYIVDEPRYLLWGDNHYYNNLRGVRYLMHDLEKTDENLFEDMLPVYEDLLRQQREANIIMGLGGAASVGFLFAGIMEGIPNRRTTTLPSTSSIVTPRVINANARLTIALVAIGGIIGTATSYIYFRKSVKQEDVFYFMNEFNRVSTGDRLELGVSPKVEVGDGGAMGLSLVLRF